MIARKHTVFRVMFQEADGTWKKDCRVFKKRDSAETEAASRRSTSMCRAYVITRRPGDR